jgi:hypothetical protein
MTSICRIIQAEEKRRRKCRWGGGGIRGPGNGEKKERSVEG